MACRSLSLLRFKWATDHFLKVLVIFAVCDDISVFLVDLFRILQMVIVLRNTSPVRKFSR